MYYLHVGYSLNMVKLTKTKNINKLSIESKRLLINSFKIGIEICKPIVGSSYKINTPDGVFSTGIIIKINGNNIITNDCIYKLQYITSISNGKYKFNRA